MGIHQRRNKRTQAFVSFLVAPAFHTVPLLVTELGRLVMIVDLVIWYDRIIDLREATRR